MIQKIDDKYQIKLPSDLLLADEDITLNLSLMIENMNEFDIQMLIISTITVFN